MIRFITRWNTLTDEEDLYMLFTPGSDDIYKDALILHAQHHGKLEIRSKVPLETKHDL